MVNPATQGNSTKSVRSIGILTPPPSRAELATLGSAGSPYARTRKETLTNRHSPDDSETSVESSDFAASLEARREMWLATSSSGSPNDGRGSDLAIFPGIWTHSFYRCS